MLIPLRPGLDDVTGFNCHTKSDRPNSIPVANTYACVACEAAGEGERAYRYKNDSKTPDEMHRLD
jgi:hypothetical protein